MLIGTAGHIDHGKTALVKALTGVDTDRLSEEKSRGISIDLGFAYAPLSQGDCLGFVDVPGHEKFIPNMLAGATGIDYVLLIVAADDGPMPQTVEHLQILDLLGLNRGAVALTKIDRVGPERIETVKREIETLLAATKLADSKIFAVSAITGMGVEVLRTYLEKAAVSRGPAPDQGGFRLAVDRSFSLTGVGTVVTGTVFSGRVRTGDRLLLSPSGLPVRVRGIHAQNRPAEQGRVGQRCALNLAGVEKQQVQRGDWVLSPPLHAPTLRLDLRLDLLAELAKPLAHWTPVHVHLGTAHASAHVALLQEEALQPGARALAQLVLDRPVCTVRGDRCLLRDASGQSNLAGGMILDSRPPSRGRRKPQRLAVLGAWQGESPRAILQALLECSPHGVDLTEFARNINRSLADLEILMPPARRVEGIKPRVFSTERWEALRLGVLEALREEHESMPDSLGLNAEQLRLRTAAQIDRSVFAQLLSELEAEGLLVKEASWFHLPGHRIVLVEAEERLWAEIAPLLTAQAYQPPRVRDIAHSLGKDEAEVRKLLARAARLGRVYRIAHDHYFDRKTTAELAEIARQLAAESPDGLILAAEYRNRIGTGRKLAIHILEFFDRVGFTRRLKDAHRLRHDGLAF
ncbi:MAG: selenocysteine-specific translation elongation factor [Methylococcaceae bacterium]|nr:selenocysteine-specific translation elongation factor [Methylococcaceae bacterium]